MSVAAPGKIGFRLAGDLQPLTLVPVSIDGRGPFEFILDTGAGTTLLSKALATELEIKITGSKEGQTAGGKVAVSLAEVRSIAVGEAKIENLPVAITDLSAIGQTVGAKIDGDLGYNFLKNFRLTVDYERKELFLDDPKRFGQVAKSSGAELPIRLAHPAKPLILFPAHVNGRGPFQFALDTGTSTTAISPELARDLGLSSTSIGPVTTGGAAIQVSAARLKALRMGGVEIQDIDVIVAEFFAMLSQAVGAKLDGIIGYNFLRHFRVVIDYPSGVLMLQSA